MSDIIQEIESVVKEEKERSSPIVANDKNEIEAQNSEGKHAVITLFLLYTIEKWEIFSGEQPASSPPRHGHQGYRGEYEASPSWNGTSH